MIDVMVVFGTRPEAIKVAPVIKELEKRPETHPIVCVTAQHREMLDQVLKELEIKTDYDKKMQTTLSNYLWNVMGSDGMPLLYCGVC